MDDTYVLNTYELDTLTNMEAIWLPGYDGDPYGDTVPFAVGSNQSIVEFDQDNPAHRALVDEMDNLKCIDTDLGDPRANTAAKAALDTAREIYREDPECGGCKAFWPVKEYTELGWVDRRAIPNDALMVIMFDGCDFASLLNPAYEQNEMLNRFYSGMLSRGFDLRPLNHFSAAVLKKE
jgi:hypothetical protein